MICHMENMILSSIRQVSSGLVNDVYICRDLNSPTGACYTLLVVKDRVCAKKMISVLENCERDVQVGKETFLRSFCENENVYYLFDYRQERRFSLFAGGQIFSSNTWETIFINLVIECLSCQLPYPLLYLALRQDNIHIGNDNSVYFTPYFDLCELDETKNEASCIDQCVKIMLTIYQEKITKKAKSFELLQKKVERDAYNNFPELYRDIRITQSPDTKITLAKKFKFFWQRNRDRIFKILLILSVVIVVFSLIALISQIVFGNVPIFRIFEHCFDMIGTEKLN